VPVIASELGIRDRLGSWKARWGIGRMSYLVPPGLYALGEPAADDPVVVTANYKMSYDIVRRALKGRNAWLLVLETYGINVWCAAGKGTFGTGELVRRVEATFLGEMVTHRRLVLPLLGAAGVSAHEVGHRTGFTVRYATIRADDLPAYFDSGMTATPEMRELTFTAGERLVLAPIEIVAALKWGFPATLLLFLAGGAGSDGFSIAEGIRPALALLGAVLAGSLCAPLLLPWLPTRSFAVKGAVVGLVWVAAWALLARGSDNAWTTAAFFLLLPTVASFLTLNFTGSTPFTSRSGVKKEMRFALPAMACALVAGMALLIVGRLA
jgi:hypothetical protein